MFCSDTFACLFLHKPFKNGFIIYMHLFFNVFLEHSDLGCAYIFDVYSLQNKCKAKNSTGSLKQLSCVFHETFPHES